MTQTAASLSGVPRAWAGDKAKPGISPSVVVVISTVGDRSRRLIALRVPRPAAPPSRGTAATDSAGSACRRRVPRARKKGVADGL